MHGVAIEPRPVVVELVAVAEVALHALSVRSRKPPWYSYDAVTTRSASRVARSLRPSADRVGERAREQRLDAARCPRR